MIRHNNKIILGVDMGNFNMKTAGCCFPSAFVELTGNGNRYEHTLRYEGRDYALGGKRVAQRDDKAAMNEDFLVLTLFAIAMELEQNKMPPSAYDVYLSTALPPAYLNNREMRSGLKQFFRRQAAFLYNGKKYKINIVKVYVCPQGIAAAYAPVLTDRMEKLADAGKLDPNAARPIDALLQEPISILVDIGGGTADPVVMKYGVPQPFEDDSPARGVIWTYNRIRSDIKAKMGVDLSEEAVNMFLAGDGVRIGEQSAGIIRDHMARYANRLYLELKEKGLPSQSAYTLVQGGGAGMVRETWSGVGDFAALDFLPELKATAQGCEVMAQRMMAREVEKQESKVR